MSSDRNATAKETSMNAQEILDIILDRTYGDEVGLRRMTAFPGADAVVVGAGDELSPSYVWVDGDPTDDTLDGTSTIGVGETLESINAAIAALAAYEGQMVIVAGFYAGNGADRGEVLIRKARVLAVVTE
jgi:hypothetical protein